MNETAHEPSFVRFALSPQEFATTARLPKSKLAEFEAAGALEYTKRKVGNAERKFVSLVQMREFFNKLREGRDGGQAPLMAYPAGTPAGDPTAVAAATGFIPRDPLHRVHMFYNVKGGTGKSTLTAQFAMRAAMLGYRVLAIDLDGQGHLTVNLDVLDAHERPTIYDVLINDLPMADAIVPVAPGLDLLPANLSICNIEIPLNMKPRREYRLGEAIATVLGGYDLVVADTNPAASILNGSMLVAAEQVSVVCATNPLSFHGMSLVMTTIADLERELRHEVTVRVIPNLYDNREVISQEVLGELRAQFPEACTRAVVNRSADLNEATKRRTTVWDVNAKGAGALDIAALTEELLFTPREGTAHERLAE